MYTGKALSADGKVQSELGLWEQSLRSGKYQIFYNNYFSTCCLFDTLLSYKLYACVTARTTRRELPETFKQVQLERGEHLFFQHGNLVASVWMDKKLVTVLSTLAQADVTYSAQRRVRDGSRIPVQCPDVVVLFYQYMAGVDRGDQHQQYSIVNIYFGFLSMHLQPTILCYHYFYYVHQTPEAEDLLGNAH